MRLCLRSLANCSSSSEVGASWQGQREAERGQPLPMGCRCGVVSVGQEGSVELSAPTSRCQLWAMGCWGRWGGWQEGFPQFLKERLCSGVPKCLPHPAVHSTPCVPSGLPPPRPGGPRTESGPGSTQSSAPPYLGTSPQPTTRSHELCTAGGAHPPPSRRGTPAPGTSETPQVKRVMKGPMTPAGSQHFRATTQLFPSGGLLFPILPFLPQRSLQLLRAHVGIFHPISILAAQFRISLLPLKPQV